MKRTAFRKFMSCFVAVYMVFTCNMPTMAFAADAASSLKASATQLGQSDDVVIVDDEQDSQADVEVTLDDDEGGETQSSPASVPDDADAATQNVGEVEVLDATQPAIAVDGEGEADGTVLEAQAAGTQADPFVGGEVIETDGVYYVKGGAKGIITIADGLDVELVGEGYTSDKLTVSVQCGANVHLTITDWHAGTPSDAGLPIINFPSGSNTLSIMGTNLIDHDTASANYGATSAAIQVPTGSSLLINGSGALYLYKTGAHTAIGGTSGAVNGAITFGDANNGSKDLRVFVKGSKQGALVGAGASAGTSVTPGDITFNSGN